MSKRSAGLVIFRFHEEGPEVLLVHPGGPYWRNKDENAWSIPKGLVEDGEDELAAARREVAEETGLVPQGPFHPLGDYRQPGGKHVLVWATETDRAVDPVAMISNTFRLEWPPRSGRHQEFPEVDRAEWFNLDQATVKLLKGQKAIITDLKAHLLAR